MFIFFTLTTIYAVKESYGMWALMISVANLIYNVYPNLLQQFIRVKLLSTGKSKKLK